MRQVITQRSIDDFFDATDKELRLENPHGQTHPRAHIYSYTILQSEVDSGMLVRISFSPAKPGCEIFITNGAHTFHIWKLGGRVPHLNPGPPAPTGIQPSVLIRGDCELRWSDNRIDMIARAQSGAAERVFPRYARPRSKVESFADAFHLFLRDVKIRKPEWAVAVPKGLTL